MNKLVILSLFRAFTVILVSGVGATWAFVAAIFVIILGTSSINFAIRVALSPFFPVFFLGCFFASGCVLRGIFSGALLAVFPALFLAVLLAVLGGFSHVFVGLSWDVRSEFSSLFRDSLAIVLRLSQSQDFIVDK